MAFGNAFGNALAQLLFNNVDIANLGDANGIQGSAMPGNFYISFHTADPGVSGNQTTSEGSYTGYERIAVARSSSEFTVTGKSVATVNNHDGGLNTSAQQVFTHFAIGTQATGNGVVIASAALTSSITVPVNGRPRLNAGATANFN